MKIYDDYVDTIRKAMSNDSKSNVLSKSGSLIESAPIRKSFDSSEYKFLASEKKLLPSLEDFTRELGLTPNFDQTLGLHPDFNHLKNTADIEKHYIVSMFVDIKGSTNLFKRYDPETVFVITHTIQQAAIHTCLIFGGYIHRLHGDGLFVYYGGKQIDKSTAVLRSLHSASVFTYFVKNDLKNLFIQQGIEDVYTRIGIDLGDDADVIWAMAGIGEISEVTTCSLHTSLASKMQGSAQSNGIVIGDNIKDKTDISFQQFFSPVCQRTGNEKDRYIFQISEEKFNYTQFDFDWLNFLKVQEFIATDFQGNLSLKKKITKANIISDSIRPIASLSKPYYGFKNTKNS